MKGISVWMFSKIVMLVFLVSTFSVVIGFLRLTNERVSADAAEALAMQIKDAIQTTLHTNTISSQAVVPVPKTIPESGGSIETGKLKTYTVVVNQSGDVIYAAIGWGERPSVYVAASSFMSGGVSIKPINGLTFSTQEGYRYFKVAKSTVQDSSVLCFQACKSFDSGCTVC